MQLGMRNEITALCLLVLLGCSWHLDAGVADPRYDVILRQGLIYDGSGEPPFIADVAISGDRIAAIGDLGLAKGVADIDVAGMAVAPGFINMLSWAPTSLVADGRAQSDIRQGVTLEVFGEGWSAGPLTDAMKTYYKNRQGDIQYEIEWTTLDEGLSWLEQRGVAPNIASFVGATTVRIHVIGFENRAPTDAELRVMEQLVRDAMEEGAMGLGSSLIYAPASYADTSELVALAGVVGEYGGMYVSHVRSESGRLLEALDELLFIARAAGVAAEVYHLKASGRANWAKLDAAIEKIDTARAEGLDITANIYTYPAGASGLDATMPLWVQEGGHDAWVERLRDPEVRSRVIEDMRTESDEWSNLLMDAGPEKTLLIGFKNDDLKGLTGKTLAEVAKARGQSPEEAAIDLVIEDDSRVGAIFFLMSDENVAKKVAIPWVSFGSDEGAPAPEGVFLGRNPHPRAYGTFARVLGKYVRDEKLLSLEEAIRKLAALPAANLKIPDRGRLLPGFYADVVVFDPETIADHATFDEPHQYATGMRHVFVNGTQVLANGEHTGATPGRVVRGPGWQH